MRLTFNKIFSLSFHSWLIGLLLFVLFYPSISFARPTSKAKVKRVVLNWLTSEHKPLGASLGLKLKDIVTYPAADGQPLYHIVNLTEHGYIIVAGDDLVEPIIGFVSAGEYYPSMDNPLGALVTQDVPSRVKRARGLEREKKIKDRSSFSDKHIKAAQKKWLLLDGGITTQSLEANGVPATTDIRVAPLLQTQWGQTEESGGNVCYNRFTPNNDPCGCVATAFAQILRFFQFPTTGVGTSSFTISVDDVYENRDLLGGNDEGGPYAWASMSPGPAVNTATSRAAIGRLTHDAGITVEMNYTATESGTDTRIIADALKDVFSYSNAIKGYNAYQDLQVIDRNNILNPNLDAGYPVALAIRNRLGGHAIVSDGYGYDGETLYHHLNMGWSSLDDAWYNLPDIDAGSIGYAIVYKAVYNIYTSGHGEIISGRVTDLARSPVSGAIVTATTIPLGLKFNAVTNANGIYAFTKIYSNMMYEISVSKTGYAYNSQTVVTGHSIDNSTVGNIWGVDFGTDEFAPSPDLVIPTLTLSENILAPNQELTIGATVLNQGMGTADATTLRFYLSEDNQIVQEHEVATTGVVSLLAKKTATRSVTINVPNVEGTYWVSASVDAVETERNYTNQNSWQLKLTVSSAPDLATASMVSESTLTPNQPYRIHGTVVNYGTVVADSTIVRYYLSSDKVITTDDIQLATNAVPAMAPGLMRRYTADVFAPLIEDIYWIGTCVDEVANELKVENQCSAGIEITVSSTPDLVALSSVNESMLIPGQVFTITGTALNEGTAAANATTIRFYLSDNSTISPSDTELGVSGVLPLIPGGYESSAATVNAPDTEGTYWIGTCVDAVVGESPVTNQCSTGVLINVAPDTVLPYVSTQAVNTINSTTATGNGTIISLGNPNPTQHGFCWSTSVNPTTSNSCTKLGPVTGISTFTSSITGLLPGTIYYVRAYATNSVNTAYGNNVPCVSSPFPWPLFLPSIIGNALSNE